MENIFRHSILYLKWNILGHIIDLELLLSRVGKVLAPRSAGVLPVEEVESLEAPARSPRYSSVLHLVQVWRHGGGGGGDGLVRVEVDTHLQFISYSII